MRKRKFKKKKKKINYNDPSDKDLKMAKAYGGVARGSVKRTAPPR
jgi:hypothetical protein